MCVEEKECEKVNTGTFLMPSHIVLYHLVNFNSHVSTASIIRSRLLGLTFLGSLIY